MLLQHKVEFQQYEWCIKRCVAKTQHRFSFKVNIAICFAPFACDESLVLQNNSIFVRNGECYHTLVEPCKIPSNLTKWTQNYKMGLATAVQNGRRLRWYDDEKYYLCWVQILPMSHNWEAKMKSQSSIALKLIEEIIVGGEQMPFFDKIFWSGYTHNIWGLASLVESGGGWLIAICPILAPLSATSLAPLSRVQFQGLYFTKPWTITPLAPIEGFMVWGNQFLGTYPLIWKTYGRFRVPM